MYPQYISKHAMHVRIPVSCATITIESNQVTASPSTFLSRNLTSPTSDSRECNLKEKTPQHTQHKMFNSKQPYKLDCSCTRHMMKVVVGKTFTTLKHLHAHMNHGHTSYPFYQYVAPNIIFYLNTQLLTIMLDVTQQTLTPSNCNTTNL